MQALGRLVVGRASQGKGPNWSRRKWVEGESESEERGRKMTMRKVKALSRTVL